MITSRPLWGIPFLTGLERFNSTHWRSGEKVIDLDLILSVGHGDPRFRSLGPGSRSWMLDLLGIVCRSDLCIVSHEKVAFNYLRENYTELGQPIVHGLVNFKPELVPDIPSGKFSG